MARVTCWQTRTSTDAGNAAKSFSDFSADRLCERFFASAKPDMARKNNRDELLITDESDYIATTIQEQLL